MLFKDKGTGMRKASAALWTKLANELSSAYPPPLPSPPHPPPYSPPHLNPCR